MGIARITYYFDFENFRKVFVPISKQLYRNKIDELKNKAQDLAARDQVSWKLLDQLSYWKDDFGNEEEEFEELRTRIKFWILTLISSFCEDPGFTPLDPVMIVHLFDDLGIEDKEVIRKLQSGRPLGSLLLSKVELRPALDRDDSKWPYWCQSYGSLGWLNRTDINNICILLNKQILEGHLTADENKLIVLQNTLNGALKRNRGLFLGISC
jgi:hypothetical protein